MAKKLKSIGIFWRNDQGGGFGLYVKPSPSTTKKEFEKHIRDFLEAYERGFATETDKDECARALLSQLADFAKLSEAQRNEHYEQALGNIHILVKYKYMPDDEYNGILYLWESSDE